MRGPSKYKIDFEQSSSNVEIPSFVSTKAITPGEQWQNIHLDFKV